MARRTRTSSSAAAARAGWIDPVVGVVLFCSIASASFGVFELTAWLQLNGAAYFISVGCHLVGYFLFVVDVICAGFFLLVEALKFVREIWNTWR
jgi:hypothetical protein